MNYNYIELALKEAKKAYKKKEVPVGCVIVKNNKVIAKAHNMVEKNKNCTMHAEIIAIKKASKKLKNWRLLDCDMYVTLEPCLMCKAAIELSRIKNVYYCTESNNNILIKKEKYKFEEHITQTKKMLHDFFKKKR